MRDGRHMSCMVGCSDGCTLELESNIAVVSGDGTMDVGSRGRERKMVPAGGEGAGNVCGAETVGEVLLDTVTILSGYICCK